MKYHLRAVDLDFLATAPKKLVFAADVAAPRAAVFAAISADPSSWTWFPGISWGRYEGPAPYGVGSRREVRIGGTGYRETILAWNEPSRWAYRVDASSLPLAHACVEDWVLEDHGDHTTVRWIFAVDPTFLFQAGLPLAPLIMGGLFRRAMRNLSRTLASATGARA